MLVSARWAGIAGRRVLGGLYTGDTFRVYFEIVTSVVASKKPIVEPGAEKDDAPDPPNPTAGGRGISQGVRSCVGLPFSPDRSWAGIRPGNRPGFGTPRS